MAIRVSGEIIMLLVVDKKASTGRAVRIINKHDMEHMPYLGGPGSRREAQRSLHSAAKISAPGRTSASLLW
jgi:hypothetical protein